MSAGKASKSLLQQLLENTLAGLFLSAWAPENGRRASSWHIAVCHSDTPRATAAYVSRVPRDWPPEAITCYTSLLDGQPGGERGFPDAGVMAAIIELEGIWKTYDTVVAVRDFRLEVPRSRTMGLIGPNGAGKTTLLRIIATLAKPDRGRVTVCGSDALTDPRQIRRRAAFMPAEFGCPLNMTIGEYLTYFACMGGVPRRKRRAVIEDALALTDLSGREDVLIRGLSTGNRKRMFLAKTLLSDPEILILDEPASGLDPRARIEVRSIFKELAAMGKTIIISSHILSDIEDICTDVCIIEAGKEVISGSIEEMRSRYAEPNRIVRLRVRPNDADRAETALRADPNVLRCERSDAQLVVWSGRANCNFILKTLIDDGIEVLDMREERPDLETVFMRSTKGIIT